MRLERLVLLIAALVRTAAAQTASGCPAADMQPTGVVEGALASSDCPVYIWAGEETRADEYRLTITQPGVLSIHLYSTAFSPSMIVFGPQRNAIASQTDFMHTSHARILVSLAPGTYIIQVTSWGYATGPYTLTSRFDPLRACTVGELRFGETVNGDFARSSCRQLDLQVPSTGTAGVERFRLNVERRGIVTINVTSPLNASGAVLLRLYDAAGRQIPAVPLALEGLKLVLMVSLQPGVYTLDMRGEPQSGIGAFTLTATFDVTDPANCSVRALRWNVETEGVLNFTGCRFMDVASGSTDASVTEPYMFTTTERGAVSVTLSARSVGFLADLMFYDRRGRELQRKRYGGGTPAIQMTASLEPGTYYVYIRAVGLAGGDYRLRAVFEPPRACEPRMLAPDQMASGELSERGCRVLDRQIPSMDDSPQALYQMRFERRGVLTLDLVATYPLEATLSLVTESGSVVQRVLARGGAGAGRLESGVNPGLYLIEVRGSGTGLSYGRTGLFTLKTSFQGLDPRTCVTRDLSPGQSLTGTLNPANCRMLDLSPLSPSTAPADPYRITLAEAGVLTIEMISSDFDAYLSLLDRNLGRIGDDDNSGGGRNARLVAGLNAGTYVIHARSADGKSGTYGLTATFRRAGARECPVESLPLAGPVSGSLTASDCRMLDVLIPSTNTAYVDRYRLVVPLKGVLTLEMSAPGFAPALALYSAANSQMGFASGSAARPARVTISLNPGAYFVFASSAGAGIGTYALQSSFRPLAASCPEVEAPPGSSLNGVLGDASCRVLELEVPSTDSSLANRYRVTPPRRGILTIEMESQTLDPALRLIDAQLRGIASNFARSGSVARVVATVDAAPYTIVASSAAAGAFALRVRFQDAPAPDCSGRAIGLNETASGALEHGGCRVKDAVEGSADHAYAAVFKIALSGRGTLGVEVAPAALFSSITLYGPDFRPLATGTYSAAAGRTLVTATAAAGEYLVIARSAAMSTGSFTLTTVFEPAPPAPCFTGEIGLEASAEGELSASDCSLRDALPAASGETYTHRYLVAVEAAGELEVELSSSDFVPLAFLQDPDGQTAAEGAVTGEESAARIKAEVRPGAWVILVTSARPATGRYVLKTLFRPATEVAP